MHNLPDYKDDAVAYEIEENCRPDELLMIHIMGATVKVFLSFNKRCNVIDLCCGTGLSMLYTADHPNAIKIAGVDISSNYLDFNRKRFESLNKKIELHLHDAVSFLRDKSHCYDVVTMASAYHHIEDDRKLEFLKNVKASLTQRGRAFFAENILPDYKVDNKASYNEAVSMFYRAVLKTAKEENPELDEHSRKLIWRVAQYGFDCDFEYKVSKTIFQEHLLQAGFKVESMMKVWPGNDQDIGSGGNYVVVAR